MGFMALSELPEDVVIVLIGDESVIKSKLSEVQVDHSRVEIIHADENITMHDHPTTVIRQKQNSSISIGLSCLCKGKLDAFASTKYGRYACGGDVYIKCISWGY